eukprot:Awhi_evm1s2699
MGLYLSSIDSTLNPLTLEPEGNLSIEETNQQWSDYVHSDIHTFSNSPVLYSSKALESASDRHAVKMDPYEKLDGDIKAFVREWEHLVVEDAKALKNMGEEIFYWCTS